MIKTTTAANNKTIVIKKDGGRKVHLAIQLQYVSLWNNWDQLSLLALLSAEILPNIDSGNNN